MYWNVMFVYLCMMAVWDNWRAAYNNFKNYSINKNLYTHFSRIDTAVTYVSGLQNSGNIKETPKEIKKTIEDMGRGIDDYIQKYHVQQNSSEYIRLDNASLISLIVVSGFLLLFTSLPVSSLAANLFGRNLGGAVNVTKQIDLGYITGSINSLMSKGILLGTETLVEDHLIESYEEKDITEANYWDNISDYKDLFEAYGLEMSEKHWNKLEMAMEQ